MIGASAMNENALEHVEVVVVGGGPGGYAAAFRLADLGRRVLIVEQSSGLGGVCLNVGCIPSKALLHAARVVTEARELGGLRREESSIDLAAVRKARDEAVRRLSAGLTALAGSRRVHVLHGTARFTSANSIEVSTAGGTRMVRFDHAVIAVGSTPIRLSGVPYGHPRVMESTQALAFEEIPQRLLVIGGGVIGLELATVYHAFGSKVTIVEMSSQLIPQADGDLVEPLATRLSHQYEAVMLETELLGVEDRGNELAVRLKRKANPAVGGVFDKVLVAVGRRANGGCIGAENAGINCQSSGVIAVDRDMRTNVAHIFAVGDVTGGPMLAHKASHQAKIAAEAVVGRRIGFDARCMPVVAYTDPELAWTGMTEREARTQGRDVEVAKFPWSASARALTSGCGNGLTKLIFERTSRRLVGAGIVGRGASELVSELTMGVEMDAEIGDFALAVHPHPTLAETIAFAAERADGALVELHDRGK